MTTVRVAVLVAALCAGCSREPQPGFSTPESVCYDASADVYLVSNVDGAPLERDGKGYILKVGPQDGSRTLWIHGDQTGVTLNAPKGMALVGDVLWVADIDVVRKFDRGSGAPMGEVAIEGATFLNDVAGGPDGSVYVSDSGLDANFASTGTDAIWRIAPDGAVTPLIQGEQLGQPNGISAQKAGLYVVSWRDGTFYEVDYRGAKTDLGQAPQKKLDGLVRVEHEVEGKDGQKSKQPAWYATSWDGSAIYRFALTGGVTALPVRLEQPADMGYDSKRNRLIVPLFGKHMLHVEQL
ncbi:MAG: SMP-30/gluconolactonase/LRE family protein [Planctomycetota bacterium]